MAGEIEKMLSQQPTPMMQRYLLDNLLIGKVHHIEALELMRLLPDASVDAIITDLPYGTTACAWDVVIPFEPMWAGIKRVLKPRGVFVTTASQPFTSALVMSNPEWFYEEIIWDKVAATGYFDANRKHLKAHENILVFCDGTPAFTPQMKAGKAYTHRGRASNFEGYNKAAATPTISNGERFPKSIIEYSASTGAYERIHPTQKSEALYRYLVRTYSKPRDLVLDFCCGSATTGAACREEGRRFILGEKDADIAQTAQARLDAPYTVPMFAAVGGD